MKQNNQTAPANAQASNTLCDCGHVAIANGCTTGYGENSKGEKICFACCGERDKKEMAETGKAVLYLTHRQDGTQHGNFPFDKQPASPVWELSNWPGTLKISAWVSKGSHNIARTRYDAWFTGPDGKQWHGTQYGENTQICHCKRIKS